MSSLEFNPAEPTVMHIDLNSCFATIEQQANPHLRGKPIAVAAYDSPGGCILAPSIEAKRCGVQTGMRVKDGRLLCPGLIVKEPDTQKYRFVHKKFRKIMSSYTADYSPKSIDEFVLHLAGYPALKKYSMHSIGQEIKKRIKREIGSWLTVSIGISVNRFLAKVASSLDKPDGLRTIDRRNFRAIYDGLGLTDLPGIAKRNEIRLAGMGVYSVREFHESPLWKLKAAFASINGFYWYSRLRGWEIDDIEFGRRSFGNSYALPHSDGSMVQLLPILQKLTEKAGARMRRAGYTSQGVHLALNYKDGCFWHKGKKQQQKLFDSRELYREAARLLSRSPGGKPVHILAVSFFNLTKKETLQLELFDDREKRLSLTQAQDSINDRFGDFVVSPARMVMATEAVKDRISFGGVSEL